MNKDNPQKPAIEALAEAVLMKHKICKDLTMSIVITEARISYLKALQVDESNPMIEALEESVKGLKHSIEIIKDIKL